MPSGGQAPSEPTTPPSTEHMPSERAVARVFFSGHSLLDNPMTDWVELIATSRGHQLGWEQQIVIGSPIRIRTKGANTSTADFPGYAQGKGRSGGNVDVLAELASPSRLGPGERYDTLLITERHDLLLSVQWEDTIAYLADFHGRLTQHEPNAKTLLYQVWPDIDKAAPERWTGFVRQELFGWECVAQAVNVALEGKGQAARVAVVPGALALADLVERALAGDVPGVTGAPRARLDRIFVDDVHLAPLGNYLLAALHYAALFGKSPVGAALPSEVPSDAAPVLQTIAWEALARYHTSEAPWAHPLSECRSKIASDLCPAYFEFHGRPGDIPGCGAWAEPDGPLSP